MTILPSHPTALTTANHSHQTKQTAVADSEAKTSASAGVSVSASYSSTVTIGGAKTQSHTYTAHGVAKYEAIGDTPKPKNPAADNILAFISHRVAMDVSEGATSEEIESRLAAALEGFLEGYGQARDQLSGAGFLSPDIEAVIQDTYDTVLAGIDELAEQYSVQSPVVDGEAALNDDAATAKQGFENQVSQPIT